MQIDCSPLRFIWKSNIFFLVAISAIAIPLKSADGNNISHDPTDMLARYETVLSAGDTVASLAGLDGLLKKDRNLASALLLRGRIHFARGDRKAALRDFQRATGSSQNSERLDAWLWLSRTNRILLNNNLQAERACRRGLIIDSDYLPLLFERALIGFSLGGVEDPQAKEYLTRVIEIDPTFGNAYRIWRDSLLFHPVYDNGRVRRAVKRYLAANPDCAAWAVEIAWEDYLSGNADSALAVLERLDKARPDFNCADRELLLARCALERDDSLGFQERYQRALSLSVERDEPTRAFAETEVILTKDAAPRWGECRTNRDKASFLRWYWLDMDDDPIEPINRRLIEHYNRLRHAELNYRLRNPHSRFQKSESYNRLLTRQSRGYFYDPDPLRRQSDILQLDPRGLTWVRLGQPEKLLKHYDKSNISDLNFMDSPQQKREKMPVPIYFQRNERYRESTVIGANHEFWFYGRTSLLFAEHLGAREYVYVPQSVAGPQLNMLKVLGAERWVDPRVNYTLDYYMAKFLAENSFDNEIELYQDDRVPKGERPTAAIAVYDTLWGEIERRESEVFRIGEGKDSDHWLARHRITVFPGKYNYILRIVSQDEKWMGRGDLEVSAFTPDSLQISAVVLGTEPQEGFENPERQGVGFVPRPTNRFGRGERLRVYAEFYGLRPDSLGRRHYKQWIDIVRLEEGESRIRKYAGNVLQLLTFNTGDALSSVSLSFEREADWRGDRAPETFALDTSELRNGAYRMVFQVRDNVSGQWGIEEVFFDIEKKTENL